MTEQLPRVEGDVIDLEFGGGPGDMTTGHVAIVEDDGVVIVFTEPLAWHVEHYSETLQSLGWDNIHGMLSIAQQTALRAVIAEDKTAALPVDQLSFDLLEDGDGLTLEFSLSYGPESLLWDDETLHNKAWPFIATIANMVDPGTFGSQYLFTAVERHQTNEGTI